MIHAKLLIEPTDSCVIWTGAFHKNGYGVISLNRKLAANIGLSRVQFVHRMAYLQANGELPEGLVVRHSCDNKGCYNPKHLQIGTHYDNHMDAVERGLSTHKLTEGEVIAIRESSESNRKVAKRYGVSSTTVSRIRTNKLWRHTHGKGTIQTS